MSIQRAGCTSQPDRKSSCDTSPEEHAGWKPGCYGVMLRWLARGFAVCSALLWGSRTPKQRSRTTSLRSASGRSARVTRIAIETDGDFHVRSDRLDNPDRLFFDLTGTRPVLEPQVHDGDSGFATSSSSRFAWPSRSATSREWFWTWKAPVEATTSRLDNPEPADHRAACLGTPAVQPPVKIPERESPALARPPGRFPLNRPNLRTTRAEARPAPRIFAAAPDSAARYAIRVAPQEAVLQRRRCCDRGVRRLRLRSRLSYSVHRSRSRQ